MVPAWLGAPISATVAARSSTTADQLTMVVERRPMAAATSISTSAPIARIASGSMAAYSMRTVALLGFGGGGARAPCQGGIARGPGALGAPRHARTGKGGVGEEGRNGWAAV